MTGKGKTRSKGEKIIFTEQKSSEIFSNPSEAFNGSQRDTTPGMNIIIGTVILESRSKDQTVTGDRFAALRKIILASGQHIGPKGLLLFPAGWFYTGDDPASSAYGRITSSIQSALSESGSNYDIVTGIDGFAEHTPTGPFSRDQIGFACDKNGTIGIARKFYASNAEKGHVNLATNSAALEGGHSRVIESQGKLFLMSVCHDITASYKMPQFRNPGVDGILNLVHCFYPKGQGPSGSSYFARHKFAGASKQWHCPVYGAASFFINPMPERWPSGVIWNQGNILTRDWKYEMNPFVPMSSIRVPIDEGHATIRFFEHPASPLELVP